MALDYVPSWPPRRSKINQSRKLKDRSSYTERGRQLLPPDAFSRSQELNSTERGTQLLPQCALTVCTITIHVRRTGHINQEVASCLRHPDTRFSQQHKAATVNDRTRTFTAGRGMLASSPGSPGDEASGAKFRDRKYHDRAAKELTATVQRHKGDLRVRYGV